jgi:pimeloyl-ACP methyl ester carboxylesterase
MSNKLSTAAGFSETSGLKMLRKFFPIVSFFSENAATRFSLKLFLTPKRYKTPTWELPFAETAQCQTVKDGTREFIAYTWGSGSRKVLLCHSWGGRATQLAMFIEPLIEKGYTVIGFDAPAHGRSVGQQTDMIEYSSAIRAMTQRFGAFDAILGHSFGAGNTVFSMHLHELNVDRVALIGCFSHGSWIIDKFGEVLNVPAKIVAKMKSTMEKKYPQLKWSELDIAGMIRANTAKTLVVHDRQDKEIPFNNAEKIMAVCGDKIETYITDGLGHRRIVRSKDVIEKVTHFLDPQTI